MYWAECDFSFARPNRRSIKKGFQNVPCGILYERTYCDFFHKIMNNFIYDHYLSPKQLNLKST